MSLPAHPQLPSYYKVGMLDIISISYYSMKLVLVDIDLKKINIGMGQYRHFYHCFGHITAVILGHILPEWNV